jgi:hypothetical protein
MALNPYFQEYSQPAEQELLEDLIIESIGIYGIQAYYLPRHFVTKGQVFREGEVVDYDRAVPIEVYVKNVDGWGGDGKFLSKFGLEVRDTVTFTAARKSFQQEVVQYRPNEGDLIWFPFNKKVFQITFVDHEDVFYQLGKLYTYDMSCELFEYSNESFETGVAEIDDKYNSYSTVSQPYRLHNANGQYLLTAGGNYIIKPEYGLEHVDHNAQNEVFETKGREVLDFDERDPFSERGKY